MATLASDSSSADVPARPPSGIVDTSHSKWSAIATADAGETADLAAIEGVLPAVPRSPLGRTFVAIRERRPFLWLAPVLDPGSESHLALELSELEDRIGDDVPLIVRGIVDFTVSRQVEAQRAARRPVGVSHSVLNRRRRAARSWMVALFGGKLDASTMHSFARAWVPQLTGTGPDPVAALAPGEELIEFARGAMTGLLFADLEENLVPVARALHALETMLGLHLQALRQSAADWAWNRPITGVAVDA